jgi:hypothetical protein
LKEARAGALPGDPDLAAEERAYSYFFWWNHAAGKASGKRRQILEEIEREASAAVADGDSSDRIPLHLIVEGARKELEKLGVRQ